MEREAPSIRHLDVRQNLLTRLSCSIPPIIKTMVDSWLARGNFRRAAERRKYSERHSQFWRALWRWGGKRCFLTRCPCVNGVIENHTEHHFQNDAWRSTPMCAQAFRRAKNSGTHRPAWNGCWLVAVCTWNDRCTPNFEMGIWGGGKCGYLSGKYDVTENLTTLVKL